jgi:putative membrane protein
VADWVPYCGVAPTPVDIWWRWNLDPYLIGLFVLSAGLLAMARRTARQRTCLWLAYGLLVILFLSPICALSSALFSARVVHHMALILLVAPLMTAGGAVPALLPRPSALTTGFTLQLITVWLWHAPAPYEAALSSDVLYWIMQLSLLGSAVLFWQGVQVEGRNLRTAFALLGTAVHMGLLGALITFAGDPLYAPHIGVTDAWTLTSLEDQQLAGLVMWVPASLPYLAVLLALSASWLSRPSAAPGGTAA